MNDLCAELGFKSINHDGEQLCGDHVDIVDENDDSTVIVLADGMGSGVKASILSTLTSKIISTMLAAGLPLEETRPPLEETRPPFEEAETPRKGPGRPWILAGGLGPDNVAEAVQRFRPFAVDLSSGAETDGWKDPVKMEQCVRAVRSAGR